jgi:hypothetical protein
VAWISVRRDLRSLGRGAVEAMHSFHQAEGLGALHCVS